MYNIFIYVYIILQKKVHLWQLEDKHGVCDAGTDQHDGALQVLD